LIVLAVLSLVALPARQAGADACEYDPNHTDNFFDGEVQTGVSTYGVRADIEPYNPILCGSSAESAAWALISGGSGADGYAQSGYAKVGSNANPAYEPGFHVFAEWYKGRQYPNSAQSRWFPAPVGTVRYKTAYHWADDELFMYADGDLLGHTLFDPLNAWAAPFNSQYFGETWFKQADMPGSLDRPVHFSTIRKLLANGDWVEPEYLGHPDPYASRYYYVRPDYTIAGFHIFTYPTS
jgi:hypothetical protein